MLIEMASRVSQITGLPTTEADVARVLSAVLASSDFWQVVALARRPFNQVVETALALRSQGLLAVDGPTVAATSQGLRVCQQLGIAPVQLHRCPNCDGRGVGLRSFQTAFQRFLGLVESRPEPLEELDQAYLTPSSTMARVTFMADRGDLQGKRLLVLGDDDLVGLCAALTGLPAVVTVLEIDQRLVDFINQASEEYDLAVDVRCCDLRESLPEDLLGTYDTFLTDPPDTVAGLELFIGQGLTSLAGPGRSGYFGMTLIESSLPRWRELQSILVAKYGLAITDVVSDFSTYENWSYLLGSIRGDLEPLRHKPSLPWYRSSLYRVEAPALWSVPEVDLEVDSRVYVAPESLLWTKEFRGVAAS